MVEVVKSLFVEDRGLGGGGGGGGGVQKNVWALQYKSS